MNFDAVTALVSLILGTGMSAAIGGYIKVRDGNQARKIESEGTILSRYDAENKRARERAESAEKRADAAEEEAANYRKERDKAEDIAAHFRRQLIEGGIPPWRDDYNG